MPTALKLVHSVTDAAPARDAHAAVAARRRLRAASVRLAGPTPARPSRARRLLAHVEKLSECVVAGVATQLVVLVLKAYGLLS